MKKILNYIIILLSVFLLFACSAGKADNYESGNYAYEAQDANIAPAQYSGKSEEESAIVGDKVIYEGYLSFQTKDMDKSIAFLNDKINEFGAYAVSSDISGSVGYRTYSLRVRVPVEKFNEFIESSKETGNLTSQSITSEDVSETYYDLKTRLENYEAQRTRILEMMDQAETVSDLLAIEQRLSEVQYQIESLTNQINNIDKRVSYSLVTFTVREVTTFARVTFASRFMEAISNTFVDFAGFLGEVVIFLVYALPYILLIALLIFIWKKVKPGRLLSKIKFFKKKPKEKEEE